MFKWQEVKLWVENKITSKKSVGCQSKGKEYWQKAIFLKEY